jgi:hypothetical protein
MGNFRSDPERQEMTGQRPSNPAAATSLAGLHLGVLSDLQRIVDLDAEIPDGTFKLRMSEQQLNSPEILGPSVDKRRLGPSQ